MTQQKSQNSVLALVAFIVFLDMAGVGMIVPVLPGLVAELGQTSNEGAAVIGGTILFVYALMQFLFSPIIGGLSDRFGRRPVLLVTVAAMGLDYALMAWAPTLIWLFVGRMISGVMGATWAACNSCIADIFPVEERGAKFGLLGGAGAAGFVAGPALGGLLGEMDLRLPFIAASVIALAGAVIGAFCFPETLPREKRRAFSLSRANPLGNIIQMAKLPLVIGLLAVIFLMQLAAQSQLSIWSFYGILKFSWTPWQIGLTVTFFGVLLATVQGGFTGPAIKRFGEVRTATVSLMFAVPSYLIFAFAGSTWVMLFGIVIGVCGALAFPAMQSVMTARVAEDAQGELQGAIASMISATSVIGPVMMTSIFGAFSDPKGAYFPGAPFIVAAILGGTAFLLFRWTIRRHV